MLISVVGRAIVAFAGPLSVNLNEMSASTSVQSITGTRTILVVSPILVPKLTEPFVVT